MNNGVEVVECCDGLLGSLFAVRVAVLARMNKIITRPTSIYNAVE